MTCTWKGCNGEAEHVYKSQTGQQWAKLCKEHDEIMTTAIKDGEADRLLSCYIKAKGGAQKAASQMWARQ